VLGGAEAAAERLAAYLGRRGHRVIVLTKRTSLSDPEHERADSVEIHRLPPVGERSARGKWAFAPSLFSALLKRRRDVDVVCCVDYRGIGVAALAARAVTGRPVIFQAQTDGVISGARIRNAVDATGTGAIGSAATWPIRAIYRRADAIACISRAIERETLDAGVPRDRVHYLPNPVDTRVFFPAAADERANLRRRLELPVDVPVAVFVGRLSREKGVLELLRAWDAARPEARLVVVGPAMRDHPWDVSTAAEAFVAARGLQTSVRFIGGQPTAVVASWLQAADFAVQPSHFEAMGLAAAEAMAAGLPVIASDVGGFRDFVVTDRNGLLVPVGDIQSLAAALSRLAADASLRARLGRQAKLTAEQFDENVVLDRFAQLIDRLGER
jgi:glycosyltransferase involved in cell wall biosynthesis